MPRSPYRQRFALAAATGRTVCFRADRRLLLLLGALVSFVLGFPGTAISGSFDFLRQFVDPQDGHFDMGAFLAGRHGFLPVPLIITEPAVGYGGGVGGCLLTRPRALER